MIQIHKSITLTPFHPTNGGMNAYKNFPSGRRVVLSNDNRFTPIVTGEDRNTWEPIYGIGSEAREGTKNGIPGVFGETFNVPEIPHQIITNGVVDMPTNMYLSAPADAGIWKPGSILVLIPKGNSGWQIGKVDPIVGGMSPETKYTNQQVGILLKPLEWKKENNVVKPATATIEVLIGYSKIPKKIANTQVVKATPLATPKVAAK